MPTDNATYAKYYASNAYITWKVKIDTFIATLPVSEPTPNPKLTEWLDANPRPPLT